MKNPFNHYAPKGGAVVRYIICDPAEISYEGQERVIQYFDTWEQVRCYLLTHHPGCTVDAMWCGRWNDLQEYPPGGKGFENTGDIMYLQRGDVGEVLIGRYWRRADSIFKDVGCCPVELLPEDDLA